MARGVGTSVDPSRSVYALGTKNGGTSSLFYTTRLRTDSRRPASTSATYLLFFTQTCAKSCTIQYISVHIRHTDFVQLCNDANKANCFPPLSVYGEKVDEVKADLHALHGVTVDRVLVASDEEDTTWWDTVRDYGWHRIDWVAEGTEEKYSEWSVELIRFLLRIAHPR
jgi:hypothetical protein